MGSEQPTCPLWPPSLFQPKQPRPGSWLPAPLHCCVTFSLSQHLSESCVPRLMEIITHTFPGQEGKCSGKWLNTYGHHFWFQQLRFHGWRSSGADVLSLTGTPLYLQPVLSPTGLGPSQQPRVSSHRWGLLVSPDGPPCLCSIAAVTRCALLGL